MEEVKSVGALSCKQAAWRVPGRVTSAKDRGTFLGVLAAGSEVRGLRLDPGFASGTCVTDLGEVTSCVSVYH